MSETPNIQYTSMEFPQELVDFINELTGGSYTQSTIKEIYISTDGGHIYDNLLFNYSQEACVI